MNYLNNYATGRRWEQRMQEEEEVRRSEAAHRRIADLERRASEIRPQLETRFSGSGFNINVQHNLDHQRPIAELDSRPGHYSNRVQQPPTHPASTAELECHDTRYEPRGSLSHQFHAHIQVQDRRIERLESELQHTKSETLRFRAERDENERARIQAIRSNDHQQASQLKQQVDQLIECLDAAKVREKALEADLDKAMSEKRELKRRLQRKEEETSDLERGLERLRDTTSREAQQESTFVDPHSMPTTGLSAGGQGDKLGGRGGIRSTPGSGREAPASESRTISTSTSRPSARTSATPGKKKYALSVPRGQKRDYGPAFLVRYLS
ncbi:MAG: hypothetical protein Q9211_005003 [Gyalolechia sp. 1 TL-2023]